MIPSPSLTRSCENISEETGIKIRMKGYGAIVDHGSLSTSFHAPPPSPQCMHEPKI